MQGSTLEVNIERANLDVMIRKLRVALEAQYATLGDFRTEPEAEPIGVVLRVLEMVERYAKEHGV